MSDDDPFQEWLEQLHRGDEAAAAALYQKYARKLIELARSKMHHGLKRVRDEEDVVLSAFDSFFERAKKKEFDHLNDWDDLWGLLVRITIFKCRDHFKHETTKKLGQGLVRGESVFEGRDDAATRARGIEQIVSQKPTEGQANALNLNCREMIGILPAGLQQIALWKLEGYSNREIAKKLDEIPKWVDRQVQLIRERWLVAGLAPARFKQQKPPSGKTNQSDKRQDGSDRRSVTED